MAQFLILSSSMNVTEVLQLVDQLVFKYTGKHLNDLQRNTVSGLWQGQTYGQIASEFGYDSENHIGNISRELYEILSKELGEKVTKSNFCVSIERIANSFNLVRINIKNNVTWCSYKSDDPNKQVNIEPEVVKIKHHLDLKEAPKLIKFYGRKSELSILSQWLKKTTTNLIAVVGNTGIGKTALIRNFINIKANLFDVVIWKDLRFYKSFDSLINQILSGFEFETEASEVCQLFELLCQRKCLIILDNLESIFSRQQLSGKYQSELENYKTFFKMITEREHQSCLVVISQEKSKEMFSLNQENNPNYCLELSGLDNIAKKILASQGLKDQESLLKLIDLYEGNPKYLQDISISIQEIFDGAVSEFLEEDGLILTEEMKSDFDAIWLRLSDIEKSIVLEMSRLDSPISRDEIKQCLSLSSKDISYGLQSLKQRFLLKSVSDNHKLFYLASLFKEYVRIEHQKSQILD
jgi:SpoVK/Ycf46/Vps4 family AAA+-type ATPase